MKTVKIKKRGKALCTAFLFDTMLTRSTGLMFRKKSFALIALAFESKQLAGIHTCFMRFTLDLFWLDKNRKVISIAKGVKPFRIANPAKPAKYILEAPAGKITLKTGEKLDF